MFFLQGRLQHGLVPENLSGPSVKTEQNPVLSVQADANREDAVTPHNRRSVAVPGNLGGPGQVAGRTPVDRRVGFQAGAVPAWSAPAGPVLGRGQRQRSDQTEQAVQSNHKSGVSPAYLNNSLCSAEFFARGERSIVRFCIQMYRCDSDT